MSIARSDKDDSGSRLSSNSNLLGLGWQIASTLLVFTLGGYFLDRWLDTLPWFLIGGALLGMVGVFYQILRIAMDLDRAEKRKKSEVRRPTSDVGRPGSGAEESGSDALDRTT